MKASLQKPEPITFNFSEFKVCILSALSIFIFLVICYGVELIPLSLGSYFAQLSQNLFIPNTPVGARILSPLIAYLVFLRGDNIIYLNFGFAILLLCLAYYYARISHQLTRFAAIVCMAILGLSMPTLFTLHYGAYPDSLKYVLLFSCFLANKNKSFFVFYFLGLLTHESFVFMTPFFFLNYYHTSNSQKQNIAWTAKVGLCLFLFIVFRHYWQYITNYKYTSNFYLLPLLKDPLFWIKKISGKYWLGVFETFKFLWVLPIIANILAVRNHDWFVFCQVWLIIFSVASQSLFALDTTRLLGSAFIAILIAYSYSIKLNEKKMIFITIILLVLNLCTPVYNISSCEVTQLSAKQFYHGISHHLKQYLIKKYFPLQSL